MGKKERFKDTKTLTMDDLFRQRDLAQSVAKLKADQLDAARLRIGVLEGMVEKLKKQAVQAFVANEMMQEGFAAKVVLAETANAMLRNRLEANSCARRCPFRKPLEVNHDTETT